MLTAHPTTTSAEPGALEARDLVKRFGGVQAVSALSLTVPRRLIYGVLGPNGAGKTTFLNLLSGVFRSDGGSIVILGRDVTGWPAHRIARLGVARTYQNIRLPPSLTTLEAIMAGGYTRTRAGFFAAVSYLPSERRERREAAEHARALMDTVGLTAPPDRLASTLAYGEQRRVEIARALASQPELLLLDEPTAGMNWVEASSLGALLKKLVELGQSIVVIEHNMRFVREYCDRTAVMQSGELLAEGSPESCLARSDVQEAYFGRKTDAERIQALRLLRVDTSG